METDMSGDLKRDPAALERLSALVDGELDADAAAQVCGHWRESVEARASWHAYQVIGDVLRSDDLARDPARDASFLHALRVRLHDEPVVLAPAPLAAPVRRTRWSWKASSAVAASVVVIAGAAVVLSRSPADVAVATVSVAPAPVQQANPIVVAAEPQPLVASGKLIRDARLDRYLAAHKQFAGSSALGVPSGYLRNATAIEGDR
jgi:sigma-E factor negative regulatory protein RseA